MMPERHLPLVILLLLALASSLWADVILLTDGRRLEGTLVKESSKEVVFKTAFATLTFKPSEVSRIERGKTPRQEFEERYAAAKSAEEFYRLGLWAEKRKLGSLARRAMRHANKLDPTHEGAGRWLELVEFDGRWVSRKEYERLSAEKEAIEMRKRGLVRHGERWVTLEEKEKLDAGLVYFEGKWITPAEKNAAQGLVEVGGELVSAAAVSAREDAERVLAKGGSRGEIVSGPDHVVAGPFPAAFLEEISAGLMRGRALFDERFHPPAGIELLGGRCAEFYVFGRDAKPYLDTVDYLASLTESVPPGWADAVRGTHGFLYWDPYCCSSARLGGRPQDHLAGHSYHHWGHLLLNRLGYDGRLLPPWFDEGFATWFELAVHDRSDVLCIGKPTRILIQHPKGRTQAKRQPTEVVVDAKALHGGRWRETLEELLRKSPDSVPRFDALARTQFGELTVLDILVGSAITAWLDTGPGGRPGALAAFHASLRASAPKAPQRVFFDRGAFEKRYDAAFGAAVGMDWRRADGAWRKWVLEGGLSVDGKGGGQGPSRERRHRMQSPGRPGRREG